MRVILVAALVLGAGFAGCLGLGPNETPPAKLSSNSSTVTNTSSPIDPRDNMANMSGLNETNITDTMGMHNHDYWNGRTRVIVLDKDTGFVGIPDPTNPPSLSFRLPVGHLIYEGTDHVEVLISNPSGGVYCSLFCLPGSPTSPVHSTSFKLTYQTAASGPGQWDTAPDLAFDAVSKIPIKAEQETDMPHSTGSLWAFTINSTSAQDWGLHFHIQIVIVRGTGPIPLWPAHPLFYAKSHYRVIVDGNSQNNDNLFVTGLVTGGSNPQIATAQPGRLISAGTQTLFIYVNITNLHSDINVQPTNLWLLFHNASYQTWNSTSPFDSNHTIAKGMKQVFVVKVDMNGMDSPYQSASRWVFEMRAATSTPVISCIRQCNPYQMTYHITVVASDLVAPNYDIVGMAPNGQG
ncbi:MAG: hypothetical protein ACYDDF_14510 [Thermoplasmatota archaeon]